MKTLDQILKETEQKARQLGAQAKVLVATPNNGDRLSISQTEEIKKKLSAAEVDDILKETLENFLTENKKSKRGRKKKTKKVSKVETKKPVKPQLRLTFEMIKNAYEKTGKKPFKAFYWFYEDIEKYPLLKRSSMSEDRTQATPLAAFALMRRAELLCNESPPAFITEYRDLDKSSHKWTVGRVSQITGLNISYLCGFDQGYDNNAPGHPNCSKQYHIGFEDGLKIRNLMIEAGMIEKDPAEDIYGDETNEHILSELSRVRGYTRRGD